MRSSSAASTSNMHSSNGSIVFEFDRELLPSPVYRRAFRGSIKERLLKQQGKCSDSIRRLDADLHKACQRDDGEAVASLLSLGANPNASDQYGNTALAWPVAHGDLYLVN
jgi:ankyrin repeat protein